MYGLFSENYSRVGATDLAVSYAQKGIDIDRSLITNQPDNVTSQIDLAAALGGLGDALVTKGNHAGALAAFQEANAIARAGVAKDPADENWQTTLEASLDRTGDLQMYQGDLVGALTAFRQGLEISQALAARHRERGIAARACDRAE